ncbi:sedoheptulose 7-phosphate cyclase [Streptomyces sp. NPDC088270]|uniref:sedoheptulose 7-phosphate cyclase n=1 Tax=Streptomyces sp. NPDC088270 TaxID=3160990 RepID=UPI0034214EF9
MASHGSDRLNQRALEGSGVIPGSDLLASVNSTRARTFTITRTTDLLDPQNPALHEASGFAKRQLVVADDGIGSAQLTRLHEYFRSCSVEAETVVLPGGEHIKRWDSVERLVDAFGAFGLIRRGEPVIIIGGGAVMDVGAFACSIYRRGVPHIKVPTTVLGYVDASLGIKSAVNLRGLKNRLGSFVEPVAVLLDPTFFRTLSQRDLVSGLGEILKLAVGCSHRLLEDLRTHGPDGLATKFQGSALVLLDRAVAIMVDELGVDLYENDLERVLDLGHTFSTVIESTEPACHSHGEAVAIDVVLTLMISAGRGLISFDDVAAILRLAMALGLPVSPPSEVDGLLWQSVEERSQHRDGQQRFPLIASVGEVHFVGDLMPEEVNSALQRVRALEKEEVC